MLNRSGKSAPVIAGDGRRPEGERRGAPATRAATGAADSALIPWRTKGTPRAEHPGVDMRPTLALALAMALLGSAVGAAGLAGAALAGAALARSAASITSCLRTRPPTPVPVTVDRSTPLSAASLRTSGVT